MNTETAVILVAIAIAGYLFSISRRLPIPEPVYDPTVRVKRDRSAPFIMAAIFATWAIVQLLRLAGANI